VFGVFLHAANTEHNQMFFLFVRNWRTGCKHPTTHQFFKKYLEAQQVWASKNIKKEPENVKKAIHNSGRRENSVGTILKYL
jgi:hypothetical protein